MKLKNEQKIKHVSQKSPYKKEKQSQRNTWEMSAQDALRVDTLTHSLRF